MKQVKSRVFVRPIGHIKRHVIPTSTAISHVGEPSFFQQNSHDEHSHYRTEFKKKMNNQSCEMQRPSSPNRRNKPHPVEVYHLQRLRSGLVCDVRSKLPLNSLDRNILGISKVTSNTESTSWTKSVYKQYDTKTLMKATECDRPKFPAIGIVPKCLTKKLNDHVRYGIVNKEDHWLPGKLNLNYESKILRLIS